MEKKNKKKKKFKIGKLLFCLIMLILMILGIIYGLKYLQRDSLKSKIVSKMVSLNVDMPEKYTASLIMVGYCLIHQTVYNDAYVSKDTYDFQPMLQLIKRLLFKKKMLIMKQRFLWLEML